TRLPPRKFHGQFREIDDAAVAAIGADVVVRPHEDAIDRARIDGQCAEYAFRVVDFEAVDAKALADRVLDFLDVNAIDRAGASAFITADAGREVKTMKPAITRLHWDGEFGVLEG